MKLLDIINRPSAPKPWDEGEKIPWNDPDFSKRMLNEHLSQAHNAASRRFAIIERHIHWIHNHVLKSRPTRILDLCCGPGLYTQRLSGLGHRCTGIDFSPASIAYAKEQAHGAGLDCDYFQQDIRTAEYGNGYGFAMLIFGEFNVFRPAEAKTILAKAFHALAPNGLLLLEPHTFEKVMEIGNQPPSWYSVEKGLFSDQPHLCLQEKIWDVDECVAIERYHIVDAATGDVAFHASSMQAYTDDQYRSLLTDGGFGDIQFFPSLGETGNPEDGLMAILARRT